MQVENHDIAALRGKVSLVDGGFDPLHPGHIEYFRRARELGLPVFCSISGDHYVATKHVPLIPETGRAILIDAIRYIDYTYINRNSTTDILENLQPKYYVKGNDWAGRLPAPEVEVCRRLGIEIVFLDTILDSSSRILRDYLAQTPRT